MWTSDKTANFFALKLKPASWSYNKDNFVSFIMPTASNTGNFDVILEGPFGLGSLMHNVRIDNFNPFPLNHPDHSAYIPYQLPYLSGIPVS